MVRVVSAAQYCTLQRPSLDWLVPNYIPTPGLCVLVGAPKAGKSFLAFQLALAVAGGGPFLGQTAKRGSVLYLQFDTSETVWRDRILSLQGSGVHLPDNVYMLHPEDQPTRVNVLHPETKQLFRDCLEQINPSLVVIDVFREIHNADEQDSTAMKVVGDEVMSLTVGRSVLLLHHTVKVNEFHGSPPVDPINVVRGSSYIAGKADSIWYLASNRLHIHPRFGSTETHLFRRQDNGLLEFRS